jgi:hypothetical protein
MTEAEVMSCPWDDDLWPIEDHPILDREVLTCLVVGGQGLVLGTELPTRGWPPVADVADEGLIGGVLGAQGGNLLDARVLVIKAGRVELRGAIRHA